MDIIIKIVAIGLITCLATLIVKPVRSDFAIFIAIAGGLVILFLVLGYLSDVFDIFKDIISATGISSNLYRLLIKIIGIGYLVEFAVGICQDTGNSSLGDKILLGGKIVIMVMALPIVTSILQIIMGILPS